MTGNPSLISSHRTPYKTLGSQCERAASLLSLGTAHGTKRNRPMRTRAIGFMGTPFMST